MRVSSEIDAKQVFRIINYKWKLDPPRIVVPIISNVAPLYQFKDSKLLESFKRGLMKVI